MQFASEKILFFIIVVCFFNSCRYKDNDKLCLSSVKHRLEKTWTLEEGYLNDFEVTQWYLNEEITFSEVKTGSLIVRVTNKLGMPYDFKDRKRIIYRKGTNAFLSITKLTDKELWIEGSDLLDVLGGSYVSNIKAKYRSK